MEIFCFTLPVHLTERKVAANIMLYTHWHEELGSMLLHIDAQTKPLS